MLWKVNAHQHKNGKTLTSLFLPFQCDLWSWFALITAKEVLAPGSLTGTGLYSESKFTHAHFE